MELNHKVSIDLLDFIKSGRFDFIKLGQIKEWIINNFPDPDWLADSPETYDHSIWQYGNIEFHFTNDKLSLIYSDYIDNLNGGESLELDKWIFTEPQKLNLAYVIAQLNKQRISFTIRHGQQSNLSGVELTIIDSGVAMGFAPVENDEVPLPDFLERPPTKDSNLFRLHSLSLGG